MESSLNTTSISSGRSPTRMRTTLSYPMTQGMKDSDLRVLTDSFMAWASEQGCSQLNGLYSLGSRPVESLSVEVSLIVRGRLKDEPA